MRLVVRRKESLMLISLTMLLAASIGPTSEQTPTANPADAKLAVVDPYSGRPSARIMLSRQVRNFVVRREEDSDRVIYLESPRGIWFRGEMICRGGGDPRDAKSFRSARHSNGIESGTTLIFYDLSRETSNCTLVSLVGLTPEEALALKLARPPKAKKG
jgi:hypothetical protein